MIKMKLVSSLEKCFWDDSIDSKKEINKLSMFKNERVAFQVAFTDSERVPVTHRLRMTVNSDISDSISVLRVMNVPVLHPARVSHDDNYIKDTPGLYPDLLVPWDESLPIYIDDMQLNSMWIEIDSPKQAGIYNISVAIRDSNQTICEKTLELKVIDACLPEQDLIYTQWFYCDCLMSYYKTKPFDDRHFEIIFEYMKNTVAHGVNMILTPVFTVALDTAVGHERPTTQLVDIKLDNGKYSFCFKKLGKYIDLALKAGIKYFEISHFFTQWGAKATPKVVATVDGVEKKIFGWETLSDSPEYTEFLKVFIPRLVAYLKKKKVDKFCRFHISDEPHVNDIEMYLKAHNVIKPLLRDYPIMDALSDYEFYRTGIVDIPIPSTTSIGKFYQNKVPGLWTYYCCGQWKDVSNHFIAMPSARNRIIGAQLYKFNIHGFLQWGYNFWYSILSYYPINPFLTTDADYFSEAGDHFVVYPSPDGKPFSSLRQKVFYNALTDLRAFKMCEKLYGKDYVLSIIESDGRTLDFNVSDYSTEYVDSVREKINYAIEEALKK